MTTGPVVSVIIPAYGGAPWLPATLRSLQVQTLTGWEAIVVDDCSPDDGAAIVAAWPDPRVRLIRMPANGGPVRARNHGLAHARGRYIAGLDQDDLCRPDRLARQVAYLERHPGIALLGTAVECLTGEAVTPSAYAPATTPGLIEWLLQIENPLAWSSVMVCGEVARALDPFTRPELLYAEDFDLYGRVLPFGGVARLDRPLLLYRQHPGGASKRFAETMCASAARVLTERHAALGDGAARAAALLVRHNMDGEPVPDRATLVELGDLLGALQAAFLRRHDLDAASRRLIRWETAQRWSRIGRAGLRAGTLTLADVLAVRPQHLGLGYAGAEALAMAGLVGGGRRAGRLLARRGVSRA
ncbi:glycosyltransferase family 2 protein [Sphingomonas sp.]|uniref:glycosyltransferase family 2 protein n=1 Tax=Sphingomonas sp. TaxID=28214 RepID=UPI003CC6C8F8